ncbi:kinase-like protein [Aspergillus heteromorphus CBS 117.55]|uniref:non-specific serine/threonine protein kinase n=1 Tax=Aspergillus heteromorphus CBS 117.55 TaxID=1448321 RepID=A0A317VC98_9EURO|nr:kinase-like protein [Aspergillus heteromorphus CBS 117.55]PWY69520.1 kinase-like protein [Aspergillus heteromorphus CBS 117.55]
MLLSKQPLCLFHFPSLWARWQQAPGPEPSPSPLPLSSPSLSSLSGPDSDEVDLNESRPLLPGYHCPDSLSSQTYQTNIQIPPAISPSTTTTYGTCTSILHYGTNSCIRLYKSTTTTSSSSHPTKNPASTPQNLKKTPKPPPKYHVLKTQRPTSSTAQKLRNALESLLSTTLTHPSLLHTIDVFSTTSPQSSRHRSPSLRCIRGPSQSSSQNHSQNNCYNYNHIPIPSPSETTLVTEFSPLGDLGLYISSQEQGVLGADEAACILKQVLGALGYLHKCGVGHGGVSVENVFLGVGEIGGAGGKGKVEVKVKVKLGDLGGAVVLDSRDRDTYGEGEWKGNWALARGLSVGIGEFEETERMRMRSRSGSRFGGPGARRFLGPYAAPEEMGRWSAWSGADAGAGAGKEYDPRPADIWAAGIVYLVMRLGRILWRRAAEDEDARYAEYLRGRRATEGYPSVEGLGTTQCRNVVYAMLDPNPARRIRAADVLRSEWLFGVDVPEEV